MAISEARVIIGKVPKGYNYAINYIDRDVSGVLIGKYTYGLEKAAKSAGFRKANKMFDEKKVNIRFFEKNPAIHAVGKRD